MTTPTEAARTIFLQALADCSVENALSKSISVQGEVLHLHGEEIPLGALRRVRIVSAGKAAGPMLTAALAALQPARHCDLAGVLIAPEPMQQLPENFQYFRGGHPSPDQHSFAGARAALKLLQAAAKDTSRTGTLCLFLISGGASAMMELPLDPTITLEDTAQFHRALVGSGASISEINCVRKHFSAVKGGRLALAAGASLCRSLLISDVPAGQEDALASGPTIADSSTVEDCREILSRYRLPPQFPASVRCFFESDFPETPKPAELHAKAVVLLSSRNLAEAAKHHAEALGYFSVIDNSCDEWEYRAAAKYLMGRLRALQNQHPRVCIVSAGEVSVALPPKTNGAGGRNQQLALYAATLLEPGEDGLAILSAGSDGIDGNSPAAGAAVQRSLVSQSDDNARANYALESFNAYPFLAERGAAIITGPSGNNLRDLRIFLT